MADDGRMPQMNIRIPKDTRERALEIAKLRDERDIWGTGLSAVVRDSIARYVKKHEHLLADHSDTPD